MNKIIHIGILKETKIPPDRRVPFSPEGIRLLQDHFPWAAFCLQPSEIRCFPDSEYAAFGVEVKNDLSECDILFGIKEMTINSLIPDRTYLFFSHTGKKQPHNRKLFQEMAARKITLIDYEFITDQNNNRLVAFGRWAGIVGAYNGLRAWGERQNLYKLKPAYQCFDIEEMKSELKNVVLRRVKILISGGGKVAGGAMEIITSLNIREVKPEEYLSKDFDESVLCRIDPWHYFRMNDGSEFKMDHFITHPDQYGSNFKPFTRVTDLFMVCHFWDPASPVLITRTDMLEPDFRIKVIADISCDINGSVKSTIRASTIDRPFYGYQPLTGKETAPFYPGSITVMAVDNLPCELPMDSSKDFSSVLTMHVISPLLEGDLFGVIEKATILKRGRLTKRFGYLEDYLKDGD